MIVLHFSLRQCRACAVEKASMGRGASVGPLYGSAEYRKCKRILQAVATTCILSYYYDIFIRI